VNQSGVNATTPAFDLSGVSYDGSGGRAAQLLLAAGDTGVRSIVSVTSSGLPSYPSNSHQETFAILREIAQYTYNFGENEWLDALDLACPRSTNGSCLFLMTEACSTSPQTPWGIAGRIENLPTVVAQQDDSMAITTMDLLVAAIAGRAAEAVL